MRRRAILIAVDGPQLGEWTHHIATAIAKCRAPFDVRVWPDAIGNPDDIFYACVWQPPHGLLSEFPNLKAIVNLGAGVDTILADPLLPTVPITRVAHSDLTSRVVSYVVFHTLAYHLRQRCYDMHQRERRWEPIPQPTPDQVCVGIMGLGVIGSQAAMTLARLGFRVGGWSRSPKEIDGTTCFTGPSELDAFLAHTEILVCLLPYTPLTDGLLRLSLFLKLKRNGAARGAFLINAARGRLQIDSDIVSALDEGTLTGVTLDVFPEEPLPPSSPLWDHPGVTITPHVAGDIAPERFAPVVVEQIERFERGETIANTINRTRGY